MQFYNLRINSPLILFAICAYNGLKRDTTVRCKLSKCTGVHYMRKSTKVETAVKSISYEVNGVLVTTAGDKGATYPQLGKVCNVHFDINFKGKVEGKPVYKHSDGSIISQDIWNQRRGLQSALYTVHKNSDFTAITATHIQKWIASGKVPAKYVKMIDVQPVKKAKGKKASKTANELPSPKSMIAALKAMGMDVVKAGK